MAFYPYLFFGGTCREALTRYQDIFGGELFLLPMSEAPSDEPVPADQADLIIHGALTVADGFLMAMNRTSYSPTSTSAVANPTLRRRSSRLVSSRGTNVSSSCASRMKSMSRESTANNEAPGRNIRQISASTRSCISTLGTW